MRSSAWLVGVSSLSLLASGTAAAQTVEPQSDTAKAQTDVGAAEAAPPKPKVSPADTQSPPPASGGEPQDNSNLQPQDDTSADVVVTGFRASLASAIGLKRDAIAIRDSIVAEDIGKFPEANVAESLQRIPGVELVRDGNSNEGQTVQLRGLPSNFTVTTFNGSPVYTTSGGGIGNASRTFNYDVFPSELFGRADVYKSPLAELTEGGIAGVVDLRTARPFDGKGGRKIRYAASTLRNGTTGKVDPRGSFLIGQTSGSFGALISVAAARVTNGRAGFLSSGTYSGARAGSYSGAPFGNAFDYNFAAPTANIGSYTQAQVNNALLPRLFATQAGFNKRERLGASGSLQFKNDRVDISLDGLYSVVKDDNQTKDARWAIRDSTGALSLIPINITIDKNNNLQGTLSGPQFGYADFFNRSKTKYKYGALNASYRLTGTLSVSAQASLSNSTAFRNDTTLSGDTRQLRQTLTFDTTDALFPTVTTTADLLNPANYYTNAGGSYSGSYRTETDNLRAGRLIADWDYGLFGLEGHLRSGFQYNRNRKTLQNRSTNNLLNGQTIPDVGLYSAATLAQKNAFFTLFLKPFEPDDLIPGGPGTLPSAFLAFDKEFVYGTLDAVSANRRAPFNLGSTYNAVETVKAGFIQTDLSTRVFGQLLRGNFGVRYVDTQTDIDNNVLVAGAFIPNSRTGSYARWLPSATLAYNITDDLIARAAWGKTLTRSAIQSIAASISLPAGGAGNLQLNSGNPELKPEFSSGLDGSLEWYFTKGSLLTFAAYKKTITGRAAPSSVFVPFNSLGIPSSIFTTNLQQQLAADPTTLIELISVANLNRYTLNGLELAYQQAFTFLPAPFDGLGFLANGTRVKTSGLTRTILGRPYSLNDVPKYTFQVAGYYEKGPVTVRASYNYKTKVANIGQTSTNAIGLQRYANARGFLDATASYRVASWLELRVDGANLTKTKVYDFFRSVNGSFGDADSRLENGVQNGRTVTFGIRGSF